VANQEGSIPIFVRRAVPADACEWTALRCELWPDGSEEHSDEVAAYFAGTIEEPAEVLIAEDDLQTVIGFAELSIRTDVAGLEGRRTGYVEGLYVKPKARGQNVARVLLKESRKWAHRSGCTHFASDRSDRVVVDPGFPRPKLLP